MTRRFKLGLLTPCLLAAGLCMTSKAALAEENAPASAAATTSVTVKSDWSGTELFQVTGQAVMTGYAYGRAMSVTGTQFGRVCRAPCSANLSTEGQFVVDAPGMNTANFELPANARAAEVDVKGAYQLPRTLAAYAAMTGAAVGLTGGIVWGAGASTGDSSESGSKLASIGRTMTFAGAGTLVAGLVALWLLPKTEVKVREVAAPEEAPAPEVRGKKAVTASAPRVEITPEGIAF